MKVRPVGAILLLAPVLLAAGCSTRGSASGGPPVCTTPGVSAGRITLGLVNSASGNNQAEAGAIRAGTDARFGEVNAAGGVNGRKLAYDWRDDAGQPTANQAAVQSLVDDSHAFGLIESSAAAWGGAAYLNTRGIPVVGRSADAVWRKYPNMISGGIVPETSDVWGRVLRSAGGTHVALLTYSLDRSAAEAAPPLVESLGAAGLTAVVVALNPSDDPAETARRVIATGSDSVISLLDPRLLGEIDQSLTKAGATPRVALSFAGYDQDLLRTSGPLLAGVLVPVFVRPFEAGGAALTRYLNAVGTYAAPGSDPRSQAALSAYVDAGLYVEGLRLAGQCPTRAGFLTAVHSLRAFDGNGLVQATDLSSAQERNRCLTLMRVNPTGTSFSVVSLGICGNVLGS
jgi:branched-chain amino acid transport system substrate-binding protein